MRSSTHKEDFTGGSYIQGVGNFHTTDLVRLKKVKKRLTRTQKRVAKLTDQIGYDRPQQLYEAMEAVTRKPHLVNNLIPNELHGNPTLFVFRDSRVFEQQVDEASFVENVGPRNIPAPRPTRIPDPFQSAIPRTVHATRRNFGIFLRRLAASTYEASRWIVSLSVSTSYIARYMTLLTFRTIAILPGGYTAMHQVIKTVFTVLGRSITQELQNSLNSVMSSLRLHGDPQIRNFAPLYLGTQYGAWNADMTQLEAMYQALTRSGEVERFIQFLQQNTPSGFAIDFEGIANNVDEVGTADRTLARGVIRMSQMLTGHHPNDFTGFDEQQRAARYFLRLIREQPVQAVERLRQFFRMMTQPYGSVSAELLLRPLSSLQRGIIPAYAQTFDHLYQQLRYYVQQGGQWMEQSGFIDTELFDNSQDTETIEQYGINMGLQNQDYNVVALVTNTIWITAQMSLAYYATRQLIRAGRPLLTYGQQVYDATNRMMLTLESIWQGADAQNQREVQREAQENERMVDETDLQAQEEQDLRSGGLDDDDNVQGMSTDEFVENVVRPINRDIGIMIARENTKATTDPFRGARRTNRIVRNNAERVVDYHLQRLSPNDFAATQQYLKNELPRRIVATFPYFSSNIGVDKARAAYDRRNELSTISKDILERDDLGVAGRSATEFGGRDESLQHATDQLINMTIAPERIRDDETSQQDLDERIRNSDLRDELR